MRCDQRNHRDAFVPTDAGGCWPNTHWLIVLGHVCPYSHNNNFFFFCQKTWRQCLEQSSTVLDKGEAAFIWQTCRQCLKAAVKWWAGVKARNESATQKKQWAGVPGWLSRLCIALLVSAQVMIARFVCLSPPSDSPWTARSLLGVLSFSLSLCLTLMSLSLSKINTEKIFKKANSEACWLVWLVSSPWAPTDKPRGNNENKRYGEGFNGVPTKWPLAGQC